MDLNFNIGNRVRELRRAKNMTQEQLAGELNVSAQAVSKWETGVTTPDIQLLPELSVILGVTIDDLFAIDDDARFERIDNMLYDVRYLTQTDFTQTERFLKEKYASDDTRPQAALLLAKLYNKRADEYRSLAKPLAKRALLDAPENKEAHCMIFEAEQAAFPDWNTENKRVLIDWYKGFIDKYPNNRPAYLWLLDLLLADGRTAEALDYAERMKAAEHTFHYELYRGHIAAAAHNDAEADRWYHEMLRLYPENWLVWASMGDVNARRCRYDDAIACCEKAMPLRPDPPFVDCEETVSHLYELKGDYKNAIRMQEAIIELMKTKWEISEGETLDSHIREIERLQEKENKKAAH